MQRSKIDAWHEATIDLNAAVEDLVVAAEADNPRRLEAAERRYREARAKEEAARAAYCISLRDAPLARKGAVSPP